MGLPSAPATVMAPDYFSPSALDNPPPCGLKVLARADPNRASFPTLPSSPHALLGVLAHRAIELSSKGEISDIVEWFNQQVDASTGENAEHVDLRAAVTAAKVRSVEMFLARVSVTVRREPRRDARSGGPRRTFGAEVALVSESLRLMGRADFVRRADDNQIEIIDFKTGDVRTADGEIKPAYALQLQAYALMLEEQVGSSSVRLILDNGRQELVPSDRESLAQARERIEAFTERFPRGSSWTPTAVASPGKSCRTCQIRPTCTAYIETAPSWWSDVPDGVAPLPPDTWGEIVHVADLLSGYSVDLVDAAHRRVRVNPLDRRHGLDAGTEWAWLFNLLPDRVRRGFSGERPHPRMFHELSGGPRDPQAWDTQVYV